LDTSAPALLRANLAYIM